jgi:hypothetical protein
MLRNQSTASHSRAGGYVVIIKTPHIRVFVIPAQAGIHFFFNALHYWMPDQVRHDKQNINNFLKCDTVCQVGVQETLYFLDSRLRGNDNR